MWCGAGTWLEECQRKALNYEAGRGVQGTFSRNCLMAAKILLSFSLTLVFIYLGCCLQSIARLFTLCFSIYLYPCRHLTPLNSFDGGRDPFWQCLALVVYWVLCSTPSGLKGNLFLSEDFSNTFQRHIERDMLAFTGNNTRENTITVNCVSGVEGHSWCTGHCFQKLAINTLSGSSGGRNYIFL